MNPTIIKQIWNELTDFTYIYGMEDEVIEVIKKNISIPFTRDEYGNYFVKVGDSKSLFVSHLDVVSKQKLKINKISYQKEEHEFVKTDGFTILGADDKTGVVIMLNMIDNNVSGTYYFMIGEEVGTVGSGLLYKEKGELLSTFDRCVAFDRKSYGSIINRQMGEYCCSDEFVNSLVNEFSNNGMEFKADPYGVWTDSALFMGTIPECTNLSVGYFNEHHYEEEQDITYMLQLADVVTKINWESLPTVRIKKSFDTEEPNENTVIEGERLPIYKLQTIFDEIDDLIYDSTGLFSSNTNFFKPNKEMKFFKVKDLKGSSNFSLWLKWDGSIKIKKGDLVLDYDNFDDLEEDLEYDDESMLLDILKENKLFKFNQFIKEGLQHDFGKILHLTFKGKDWFEMIKNGIKKEEYRTIKPYWESRLDGKKFDTVKLQMGRRSNSPAMYIKCEGIEKGGVGKQEWGWVEPCYKIKLGEVLKIENYE